jgi:hypothetical protein
MSNGKGKGKGKGNPHNIIDNVPHSITINGITSMSLSLHQGDVHNVSATVENAEGQALNVTVTWHSDNNAIALVTPTGPESATIIAGTTPGTANVFASVGAVASPVLSVINLGVPVPVPVATSYLVTPTTLVPVANGTAIINVQLLDQFGNGLSQARILVNFILTGSGGSLSATSAITNAAGQVTVTLTVGVSQSYTVRATDGLARTGISSTITSGALPVPPPDTTPASVTIITGPFSGFQGDTNQQIAVVKNAAGDILAQPVTWESSNGSVATINPTTGLVTIGIAIDVTNITASINLLTSSPVVITGEGPPIPIPPPNPPPPVPDPTPPPSQPPPSTENVPAIIIITGPFLTLNINQSEQLTASIENSGAVTIPGLVPDNWISSNPAVISIDLNGIITAKTAGVSNIIASYGTINSTPLAITVSAPDTTPASIAITPVTISLTVGGTQQLTPTIKNVAGLVLNVNPTSWSSDNTGIANVDTNGLVRFIAVGTCNVVAHSTSLTSNACVVTCIAAPPTIGTNFASHDFNDGTLGPFSPVGNVTVIDDPTGSGRVKVAAINYNVNSSNGVLVDDNEAFQPSGLTIGLGQTLWFYGEFYLATQVPITLDISSFNIQRKLTYWTWGGFGPHEIACVLSSFGPQFDLTGTHCRFASSNFTPGADGYIDTAVAQLTSNIWHKLKIHYRMNSSMVAADGIVQIWYDTKLIFNHFDLRQTDPTWTDDPNTIQFHNFFTGEQVNAGQNVNENRYWDNVSFADAETALKYQ